MGNCTMTINKTFSDGVLTLTLEGRLNTATAPELESALEQSISEAKILVFDFKRLEYVSSAGLRVILKAQKIMNGQGSMKIINVNNDVMEVFTVTGFTDILTIE
ncbi:MAG: STAS domain-containing protein [Candidatus Coproplasma sp.]